MLYLFWCANEHNQFRIPEFEALSQVLNVPLTWTFKSSDHPWVILDLGTEEEAVKLDASKVTFNDVNVKGSSSNFIKKKTIERNCDAASKTEFKFNFSPPENQS